MSFIYKGAPPQDPKAKEKVKIINERRRQAQSWLRRVSKEQKKSPTKRHHARSVRWSIAGLKY
jgi:hypothetical protein